jgi:hypothetical protein
MPMSTGIQGLSTLENVLHDMRHSLLSQSNTGISRANALKLAFAGIIKLLLYFPCCIAMDLTFLCEKTMKLLENILQLWKTTS